MIIPKFSLLLFSLFLIWVSCYPDFPSCENVEQQKKLNESLATTPTTGEQVISIPFKVFSEYFADPTKWPTWNHLFSEVTNEKLVVCNNLTGQFGIMPNITFPPGVQLPPPVIVVSEMSENSLIYSWTYMFGDASGSPLVIGRHDYVLTNLGNNSTMFYSWEKVDGGDFVAQNRAEFQNNLQNAQLAALAGANCLQKVFWEYGELNQDAINKECFNVCKRTICLRSKPT